MNPLYLIIGEVDGYIEEKIEKYTEIWEGIKNLIEQINDKSGEYENQI